KAWSLASHLKIPTTLKEIGVSEGDLPSLAGECIGMYPRPNSPLVFDEKSMALLYHRMWDGNLAP
ncbi:MAG TPA: hypothetical protein VK126_04440, partial [Nitrososphaerales archaeon]|nr:hypothetical protein [Nitrososphaerales archaeon]